MILASTSPRRQQLLREAGLDFRVVAPSFDEGALKQAGLPPAELTQRLAQGKARSVAAKAHPHEVIVASDTVVVLDGEVLGKPRDAGEARRMLTRLSGREHEVLSAVCLLRDTDERTFCERTAVSFYDLADEEIDAYVASDEPMDKAGAYGIQGAGRLFVRRIEGDFYTVVGLPIARLVRELRAMGALETPSAASAEVADATTAAATA